MLVRKGNKVYRKESVNPSSIGRSKAICDWAIDYIKDELPEWEDQTVYGSDLAYEITEEPNNDGFYIFGTQASRDFLRKHSKDVKDEIKYEEMKFGESADPKRDPEGFVVRMLINTVADVLAQVPIVNEHWDDKLELTKEVIDEILDALK